MMNKKLITIISVLLIIVVFYLVRTFSIVTIQPTTQNIQLANETNGTVSLQDVTPGSVVVLEQKPYVFYFSESGREKEAVNITVGGPLLTITPPTLPLSQPSLDHLLSSERSKIIDIVTQTISGDWASATVTDVSSAPQSTTHTVGDVRLFIDGSWCGVVLSPSSDQYDTYKVILHKVGGTWKVVVPPRVSVFKEFYPDVPVSVVSAVNNQF